MICPACLDAHALLFVIGYEISVVRIHSNERLLPVYKVAAFCNANDGQWALSCLIKLLNMMQQE